MDCSINEKIPSRNIGIRGLLLSVVLMAGSQLQPVEELMARNKRNRRTLLLFLLIIMHCHSVFSQVWERPKPLRANIASVSTIQDQVYAVYLFDEPIIISAIPVTTIGTGLQERITSDTQSRLPFLRTLLSPDRQRYFCVERIKAGNTSPCYDDWYLGMQLPSELEGKSELFTSNDPFYRVCVFRLSGDLEKVLDLPRSYCGNFGQAFWLTTNTICLQHRIGHAGGGQRYTLFLNVDTAEKRLIGLPMEFPPKSTPDGRHIVFVSRGVLYVDFRPVYPMYGEPLPDFGSQKDVGEYINRHLVRKVPRPHELVARFPFHYVKNCEITSSGKVLALDLRPKGATRAHGYELQIDPNSPKIPCPEVVQIDPDRIDTTREPGKYAKVLTVLPEKREYELQADSGFAQAIEVGVDTPNVVWRESLSAI